MKIKRIIIFAIICSLLVGIAFAQTNLFINGDFETGNLKGWTTGNSSPFVKKTMTVNNLSAGFFFTNRYIIQEIDLTDVSEINYDLKIAALGPFPQTFDVFIDQDLVDSYENITFDWQHQVIKTADYGGVHQIIFASNGQEGSTMNVYIDNIYAYKDADSGSEDIMSNQSPLRAGIIAPLIAGFILFILRRQV